MFARFARWLLYPCRGAAKFLEKGCCAAAEDAYNTFLRHERTEFLGSSMAEHPAVNRRVVGSNPTRGARTSKARCKRAFLLPRGTCLCIPANTAKASSTPCLEASRGRHSTSQPRTCAHPTACYPATRGAALAIFTRIYQAFLYMPPALVRL